MTISKTFTLVALGGLVAFSSCKKDTKEPETETPVPSGPSYTVPTTYNFSNADFKSSTTRIAMLGEIATYIRSTHTSTAATQPTLDAQKLKDMFANANNQFTDANLNSSGIQLENKTSATEIFGYELKNSFTDAAAASTEAAAQPMTTTASKGVRGKIISPTRAILVNAQGFEYKEFAEKGIMGATFYYQAMDLLHFINTYDNSAVSNGATAQERAWDEAFGYFGVPVDFPTNKTGLKNWGNYANSVDAAISCNTTIMNAFLKGRAAVSNKDNTARDEAKKVIINTWEKIAAAKCIAYLKGAKTNITDAGTFHHNLSEGYGFIKGFVYNRDKIITQDDISSLMNTLHYGNLYDVTAADIDNAIAKLASVFSIDASKL